MKIIQLEHQEINNKTKKIPVIVICDDIKSAENVGMAFRISEAMGVEQVFLCGETICPPNKKLLRTSRSTEKYVKYSYIEKVPELIPELKKADYAIVALEITNKSTQLSKIDFAKLQKVALVIGNERNGISPEVLELVDDSAEITMFGKNSSMNVINALSIALYEITRQLL